ncbi:hypothetical protein DYB32_008840 [Aphanomyces invadans]|uniref:FYVE-type domain-containing protein n=1 Tax=Aphanomyces invadans TaxID=157072 RepID=A0A3R6VG34_9STRA|nr:hypothetical protein DYB32_008840 [Aphanomyces invadans]
MTLPPPPGASAEKGFRCPPLHPVKERALVQRGLTALEDAVVMTQIDGGGPVVWTVHSRTKDVTVYAGRDMHQFHSMFLATTQVHGTLNEVADLFRPYDRVADMTCTDTDDVVDSAALYDLALPTPNHPRNYVGVKWQALAPHVPMVRKRDACVVEVHDDFEIKGVKGWARASTSVEVEACPNLEQSRGFVRMHIHHFAHVFHESLAQPGYVHAALLFQGDFGGRLPRWVCDSLSLKRIRSLATLDDQLQRQRLSQSHFLLPHQLEPLSLVHMCMLCSRRFGRLSKKVHCLRCGHVVCRRCQQAWQLGRDRRCQVHICHACSLDPTMTSSVAGSIDGGRGAFALSTTTFPAFLIRHSTGTTSSVHDSSAVDNLSSTESIHTVKLLESPLHHLLATFPFHDDRPYNPPTLRPSKGDYVPVVLYDG